MDKEYIQFFLKEFSYPEEDCRAILAAYETFVERKEAFDTVVSYIKEYEQDIQCNFMMILYNMRELSESIGVHEYTGQLLILLCLSKQLREYYLQKGYPLSVWKTCMQDIYYKVVECKMIYGVCGVSVNYWFKGFFQCTRFAFEKLQFELVEMPFAYQNDEIDVKEKEPVIKVHIPRTGGRLERNGQLLAYQRADEYFRKHFGLKKVIFILDSWFLFPEMKNFVSPQSNLGMFIADYTIMDWGYFEDFSKISWRIYDTPETDLEKLPQNTSLQKKYLQHIKNGGKSGWGYGIFVYPPKV